MKKALLILIILIAGLVILISSRPSDFRVSRSIVIAMPDDVIFNHVNDFHEWEKWSPWAKLDPNAKTSYEGNRSGQGAIFRWSGNKEVGEGSMTIVESRPNQFIKIKLDFIKPFAGTHTTEFNFAPQGTTTAVTWTMYGKNNFIGKAFSLFIDCDKMIGEMYEKGLTQLKTVSEVAHQ